MTENTPDAPTPERPVLARPVGEPMTVGPADVDEALVEECAKVLADAFEWDWPKVPEEHIPSPAEACADEIRAVLAHLAATGRLVGEGATFPAPRVSIRPDGGVIRALLMSDAPLSEADTLRAAAQRLAIAAQAHRDISDDDPAAQQVSTAYQEAADVLAHWAESGRVPRLGPNGRAKWRGTGEEVTGG